ncbi:helix-turn-helix domain-containing protein [Paracoccus aerius]|uniref:Helix-turn-helix domain-containing protein n=1 Tax=Paracoccus aerius TaxID=1915382 RepID=A0ABS1S7Z9_9RHOB|nr:helix-turn-helix domain-containing protein [Paracoccus aerius]MBL3673792.1 helix-turn-helix domain-containing protein [Paracoccus aerius]GHG23279.1 hypothetical protein GCM10017322_21410 [Paracoccus aerius]
MPKACSPKLDAVATNPVSLIEESIAVPRLLATDAAATILGVSPKWLERDRWVERRIPFVKVGRMVRYRASDIAAYINANIQGAA